MAREGIGRILLAICCAVPFSAAAQGLSKRGPDPMPAPGPPSLEEVFVTKSLPNAPRKSDEFATVKEAYSKVKNGGVIFIMEMNSDISNDDTGLFIDRPVTIALDPDLKTTMAIASDDNLQRASLNAAADGTCIIVGQYELGENNGRREPRNEVTFRDVAFEPSPNSKPGTCVQLNDGRLFLDNVAIDSASSTFRTGVKVNGGELVTNEMFYVDASLTGIDVRGGAVEIADGAYIAFSRAAGSQTAPTTGTSCASAIGNRPIGVFVDTSRDARVGDPVVMLRGLDVDKFDFGVCAAGAGASIVEGRIEAAAVGVRAEESIRISELRVLESKVAALIALSADSEVIDSKFYDSAIGVYLDSGKLPTFRGNKFLFNGIGIFYDRPIKNNRTFLDGLFNRSSTDAKAKVAAFTDNEVACNREAGAFEKYRLFRKAHRNRCHHNTAKDCTVEKKGSACSKLRKQLGMSAAPACSAEN